MSVPRSGHSLTAMLDGRFLITGGIGSITETWNSAEVFDPETMQFTPIGSMSIARSDRAAG